MPHHAHATQGMFQPFMRTDPKRTAEFIRPLARPSASLPAKSPLLSNSRHKKHFHCPSNPDKSASMNKN